MSERFGAAATRLSGQAALLLGWTPLLFWDATPAELALALSAPEACPDGPDVATIERLRCRFPDDRK